MIRETPLAGVGYGRWQIEWRKLVSELSRNEPDWNVKIADLPEHPFNDLLLFISEGGLVVFISLIIFWEIMALSSTYLIWARKTKASHDAGFRYLLIHILGGLQLALVAPLATIF